MQQPNLAGVPGAFDHEEDERMSTTPEYIPYSKRNKIDDPFLAKLFDYLERVAGWEIQDGLKTHSGHTSIVSGPLHLYLFEERVVFTVQGKTQFEMILPLFQQEYTCLLANYKY